MKQSKGSIKRVANGRRILAERCPIATKLSLNSAAQTFGFGAFLQQWAPAKGAVMQHKKYRFHGSGCDIWREPDEVKITFRSAEVTEDFLRILGFDASDLPFNRNFSKYVNEVYLEDDGRTVVALG